VVISLILAAEKLLKLCKKSHQWAPDWVARSLVLALSGRRVSGKSLGKCKHHTKWVPV